MQSASEPEVMREVIKVLVNHGLEVLAVDAEKGEIHVRIPQL
jgi:hypothetical protein